MDTASLIDLILERCDTERMLSPLRTRLVKLMLTEVEDYRRIHNRLTDLARKFHHFGPYASVLGNYLGNPNVDTVVAPTFGGFCGFHALGRLLKIV
jgi:hypothetical protein